MSSESAQTGFMAVADRLLSTDPRTRGVPMHVRSLVAGIGIAAVAVTVPLVVVSAASAQDSPPPSSTATPDCPRQDLRTEVKGYLTAHPDVKQEIADLKKLPKDQRAQARQQYLAAHPDARTQLDELRSDARAHRQTCRAGK
jgi:hemophore-related protein